MFRHLPQAGSRSLLMNPGKAMTSLVILLAPTHAECKPGSMSSYGSMKRCAENTAWKQTRRSILFAAVPLLVGTFPLMAAIEKGSMAQSDQDFGRLNVAAADADVTI
jgi:hypothetical protein